jgi:hypothetical protein
MAVVDVAVQSDKRNAVSCGPLEFEIGKAVRKLKAGCKDFAGVIIERVEPNSPATANWVIKGVRFGRADRDKAAKVLPPPRPLLCAVVRENQLTCILE